ncbi:hypothetical protein QTT33_004458 [Salmonella enterica]|nr:hypothetical protein [Salmonella enterica]
MSLIRSGKLAGLTYSSASHQSHESEIRFIIIFAAFRGKISLEKNSGLTKFFLSENHRFRFIDGVVDETAFIKPVKHIPVEPFPGPIIVMQSQPEKRENGIIDSFCVNIQYSFLNFMNPRITQSVLARISSAKKIRIN